MYSSPRRTTFGTDGDDWQEVEALWISGLPDRETALRAPGSGPIRSRDWDPIAKQLIDNKGVVLHVYMLPYTYML